MITSTTTSALLALSTLATFTFSLPTLPNSFFDERSFEDAPLDFRQLNKRDTATTNDYQGVDSGNQLLYFPSFERPTKGEVFQAGGNLRIAWNTTKPYDWNEDQLPKYAEVRLGYLDPNDPGYHLDAAPPLGNISYWDGPGTADLPLPSDLATRSTYFITAGSTSVTSAQFTIEAVDASVSSSAPESSTPADKSSQAQPGSPSLNSASMESTVPNPLSTLTATSLSSSSSAVDTTPSLSHISSIAIASSPPSSASSILSSATSIALAAEVASSTSSLHLVSSSPSTSSPSSSSSSAGRSSSLAAASGNVAAASATPSSTSGAPVLSLIGAQEWMGIVIGAIALGML
ncbi:hypothetical protein JCM11641_001760 [Rhodosporidiobolus odoratus]